MNCRIKLVTACFFAVAGLGIASSSSTIIAQEPAQEPTKEAVPVVSDAKVETHVFGRTIVVRPDGSTEVKTFGNDELDQLDEMIPAEIRSKIKGRIEGLMKKQQNMADKTEMKGSIIVIGPDGKTNVQALDGSGIDADAISSQILKSLGDKNLQPGLREHLTKTLKAGLRSADKSVQVVKQSTAGSSMTAILEKLQSIENRLTEIESKVADLSDSPKE